MSNKYSSNKYVSNKDSFTQYYMSLTSTVHASPSCGFKASPVSPQVTSQWTGPTFHLRLTLGTDYRLLTPLRLHKVPL